MSRIEKSKQLKEKFENSRERRLKDGENCFLMIFRRGELNQQIKSSKTNQIQLIGPTRGPNKEQLRLIQSK